MDGKTLFEEFAKLTDDERQAFMLKLKDSPFCTNCGRDNTGKTMPCQCDPWWDE